MKHTIPCLCYHPNKNLLIVKPTYKLISNRLVKIKYPLDYQLSLVIKKELTDKLLADERKLNKLYKISMKLHCNIYKLNLQKYMLGHAEMPEFIPLDPNLVDGNLCLKCRQEQLEKLVNVELQRTNALWKEFLSNYLEHPNNAPATT